VRPDSRAPWPPTASTAKASASYSNLRDRAFMGADSQKVNTPKNRANKVKPTCSDGVSTPKAA